MLQLAVHFSQKWYRQHCNQTGSAFWAGQIASLQVPQTLGNIVRIQIPRHTHFRLHF